MHQMSAENEQAGRKIDQKNCLEVPENEIAEPRVVIDKFRDGYVEWHLSVQCQISVAFDTLIHSNKEAAFRIPVTIDEEGD